MRYAAPVSDLEIPTVEGVDREAVVRAAGSALDSAEQVGDDAQQRYFLIEQPAGPAPERGRRLLVILPGGDGSADFNPFVRRIAQHAVPRGWLVAQLIAPRWSDEQFERIVWPTITSPWQGMRFSTEAFIEAVVADNREPEPAILGTQIQGPAVGVGEFLRFEENALHQAVAIPFGRQSDSDPDQFRSS